MNLIILFNESLFNEVFSMLSELTTHEISTETLPEFDE